MNKLNATLIITTLVLTTAITCLSDTNSKNQLYVHANNPSASHKPQIVCHNCYKPSINETIEHIKNALSAGAIAIELDIIAHDNSIYISHGGQKDFIGPKLTQLFEEFDSAPTIPILFIEVKSKTISDKFSFQLFTLITRYLLINNHTKVYIRSFHTLVLQTVYQYMHQQNLASKRIFLSKLYKFNIFDTPDKLYPDIRAISSIVSMVEFNLYSFKLPELLKYAKRNKLKTNIWTIKTELNQFLYKYQKILDFITVGDNKEKSQMQIIKQLKASFSAVSTAISN